MTDNQPNQQEQTDNINHPAYVGPDRRKSYLSNKEVLNKIESLETRLDEVKLEVQKVKTDTGDLVEAFKSLTGFMKVIDYLYKISKPLIWFAFVLSSLYYLFNGIKVPIPKL